MTELERQLEDLVDAHTLSAVIGALADVCYAKAEHLRTNWQDSSTAKVWETVGTLLYNADLFGL